jgi:hypothetical protein
MFASPTSQELQLANGFGSGLSNLPPFSLSHSITTEVMFSFNLDGICLFGEWCVHFRKIRPQNCKFTLTRNAFITSSKLMHTYILFEMVTPVEEVHLARKISNRKIMYIPLNAIQSNPIIKYIQRVACHFS